MLLVFWQSAVPLPSVEGLYTEAPHRLANQTVNWENQTNSLIHRGSNFITKGALVVPKKIVDNTALDHWKKFQQCIQYSHRIFLTISHSK